MSERLSNLGYLGLIKEVTAGVPLTPTDFVPLYDESMSTQMNFVDQQPIAGVKFATFATLQGQRSHKGDITVLAEPNTTARLFDMLLTKTSTTGTNPYTHVFELTGDSNSYSIDVSTGNIVSRYYGVKASKIVPNYNNNELQWKVSLSALGSFQGREIATIDTTTLTLKTTYDPAPNTGLVVGDLVRIYKSSTSATLDTTIATVNVDGITITLAGSAAAFAAGDMIYLRPATVAFTLQPSFLWTKTQFKFGATASAALSATQTRIEQGSSYEIDHTFESDTGAMRSGSFDPAALIRKTGNAMFNVKRFFDTPEDIANMNSLAKTAAVVSHLSGSTNQFECRITLNSLKTDGTIVPDIKSDSIAYSDIKYHTNYDTSDAAGFKVTVINALATI